MTPSRDFTTELAELNRREQERRKVLAKVGWPYHKPTGAVYPDNCRKWQECFVFEGDKWQYFDRGEPWMDIQARCKDVGEWIETHDRLLAEWSAHPLGRTFLR